MLFNNGSLYNAMHGHLDGELAVLKMLQMEEATITYGLLPRKRIKRSIYCNIAQIEQKEKQALDALHGSQPLTLGEANNPTT